MLLPPANARQSGLTCQAGRIGDDATRDPTNAWCGDEVEWFVRTSPKSWGWTWAPGRRVMVAMDENDTELIAMLATRIGMIMEDASIIALTAGQMDAERRAAALAEVEQAAQQIGGLVGAIRVLGR